MDAPDIKQAIDFLRAVFQGVPDHKVWFTSLSLNGGAPASLDSHKIKDITDFLVRQNDNTRSSYFCPSVMRKGANGRRKEDAEVFTGLHADIDFKHHDAPPAEIRRTLGQTMQPASIIVESGGGLHAYWLFREGLKATPETMSRVERLLHALADHVGGDHAVAHCAALMRLAGTWNSKHGTPVLARMTDNRPTARYEIEELDEWLTDASRPILTKRATATTNGAANPYAEFTAGASGPVDVDSMLAAMTVGDAEHSVHATQTKVIASMVARGVSLDEIEEKVLNATKAAHARSKEGPWNWQQEARAIRKSAEGIGKKIDARAEAPSNETAQQSDIIKSSAEFTAGFVPPDFLVGGLLQRQFCYSFTAKTGNGKTAVMLLLAAHVALGRQIGERNVERGKVLYFSGENSVDVCMRWIAMGREMDFDVNNIGVFIIPNRLKISQMKERICAEVENKMTEVALILVDTSAAYFEGNDENDNPQAGAWAHFLRSLTKFPGGPCVLIACHPTKNAADDNLLPRGGGAFLNEMDGNLTARRSETVIELHWQGKFRGSDFAPTSFLLRSVTHERLEDSKGKLLSTVVATPLSETAEQQMTVEARSEEDELLKVLADNPTASQADLANRLGWLMGNGAPYKEKVRRKSETLVKAKLIAKERGSYSITPKGEKLLAKLRDTK
jgi:AAA domain/RepB DNA-primase from phage plasmid